MSHIVTQTDIEVLKQSKKDCCTKIELLNHNNKIIDSIEGNMLGDSICISSDSRERRSYTVSILITDSTFDLSRNKKFWMNRQIRPYIGVKHSRSQKIIWYLLGTFVINETSVSFDAVTNTLEMTLSDKMCLLTTEYGGQVSSCQLLIKAGEDTRTTIIGLLHEAGIANYKVGAIREEIPYDLEFEPGTGYYDILSELCELFVGWEFYFDIDGSFIWDFIPSCYEDSMVLDNEIIQELLIKENCSNSLEGIYNKTVVLGGEIETDFFSEEVSYSNDTYAATVEMMSSYENGDILSLTLPSTNHTAVSYIKVNHLIGIPICDDSGDYITSGTWIPNTCYSFRYRKTNPNKIADFYFLGQYQPYGEYAETSHDCEFSITNAGRELTQTLIFEDIYSNDLAVQRAEYETYLACRLKDTISIEMMPVYWLNVNQKIEYQKSGSEKPIQYIIKEISFSSMGTMTVTMVKFYEDYRVVHNKKYQI